MTDGWSLSDPVHCIYNKLQLIGEWLTRRKMAADLTTVEQEVSVGSGVFPVFHVAY